MRPTTFELRLISFILEEDAPELLNQIANLEVTKRDYTGVGLYVCFGETKEIATTRLCKRLGINTFMQRNDFPYILQVVLEVENGQLDFLEIFSSGGDSFPDELDGFTLSKFEKVTKH